MPNDKPIGIDLGTTNSAMAWIDAAGRSAMIANAEGDFITPSVVFFSETEVVVGRNARTAITAHPDLVAQWVKRDMGAPYYSHPIHGHYLPPEVIQACILRKLKADLVRALGNDVQAVITVPAYFDEMRRKATADAGEMAGLRVLDIVNEPTAAAISFGEALGYLTAGGPHPGPLPSSRTREAGEGSGRQELNVLVYDLGGGTFDVTLLRLTAGKVQTLATDGDVQLGGHDWDQRLVDFAAEAFIKAYKSDPRQDPATFNRLYLDAMEAKHTLSARNRAVIQINYQGHSLEAAVTREQFEEMSADLLERTASTSRQLLAVAGLEWKDLQRVLLVGGSTRMPMVGRMLHGLSTIQPDRSVNPDEAVARGAALYASHLLSTRDGAARSTFQVTNVNAHSLGVEGIDTDTFRKKNVVLIPRNTALPARHTERFATKSEGQRTIAIKVLEGESTQPGDCIAIGRTVVRDLPAGLPKGWPVEVTFEYGSNGRLAVEALVPGTHHTARLELVREAGLSSEGLARWKQPIDSAGGVAAFESAAKEMQQSAAAAGDPGQSGIVVAGGGWTPAGSVSPVGTSPAPTTTAAATPEAAKQWSSGPQPLNVALPVVTPSAASTQEQSVPLVQAAKPQADGWARARITRLAGHLLSAVIFGLIGYLLISCFRPDLFPGPLGTGQRQDEQKQTDQTP